MKLSNKVKKITQWYLSLASIWIGYYIVRFVQTENEAYKTTASSLVMMLSFPILMYYAITIVVKFLTLQRKKLYIREKVKTPIPQGYRLLNAEGKEILVNESERTFMILNIVYSFDDLTDVILVNDAISSKDGSLQRYCSNLSVTLKLQNRVQDHVFIPFVTVKLKTNSSFYETHAEKAQALYEYFDQVLKDNKKTM